MLLDHLLGDLAAEGVSLVEAKTLDRSAGYRPYEAARAFWERRGFVQVDMIDPLPGWEPGNPGGDLRRSPPVHPVTGPEQRLFVMAGR